MMMKARVIKQKFKVLLSTGLFSIIGSNLINKILGFLSSIVLVRILTKSQFGVFSYASNIYSFFLIFNGFGMISAILQLCSEEKNDIKRKKTYEYGLYFGSYFNLILGFVILIFSMFSSFEISGAKSLIAIMFLLPFFSFLPEIQWTYLRTEMRNSDYSVVNILYTFLKLGFSCVFALFLQAKGLILGYYIADILTILIIRYKYNIQYVGSRKGILEINKKRLHKIGAISVLNNGLTTVMSLMGMFILGIFVPNENIIASYKVASTFPTALSFIPAAVVVYIYPYFARNKDNKEWLRKNFSNVCIYLSIFNLIVSFFFYLFAPLIIKIVFGIQYLDALVPFRILSISYFFSGTFLTISGNLLVTQQKLKENLYISIFSGLISIISNVILIPKFGSIGAGLSTLITSITVSLVNTSYLIYVFKKK